MKQLPENPHEDHLRAQAKDLLRALRRGEPDALESLRDHAPQLVGAERIALHDAQHVLAREYGFRTWPELIAHVHARQVARASLEQLRFGFAVLAIGREFQRARLDEAALVLGMAREQVVGDPWLACAAGDVAAVGSALETEGWANQSGGPLNAPPLVMATHSVLLNHAEHGVGVRAVVEALLEAGADPNATYIDPAFPESPLSALFGASGRLGDPDLTRRLIAAGANVNDGESLYHSCDPVSNEMMRILLESGADPRTPNVLHHQLDGDDLEGLLLLLDAGADPNQRLNSDLHGPTALEWALKRGRDRVHIEALIRAGAAATPELGWAAARRGRTDIADLLPAGSLAPEQQDLAEFLAGRRPSLAGPLSESDAKLLPEAASNGDFELVKRLVVAGWPIAKRGGDWDASALNLAVFRGDAPMVEWLLDHGASWTEPHGYGDCAFGTLSFASLNRPEPNGDYVRCAELLLASGMPAEIPEGYSFGADVRAVMESWQKD